MIDAACSHLTISTYTSADGETRLWSCDGCRIRFYPACPVCVTVGHRNELHIDTLDVDRLTLALEQAEINCWANPVRHEATDRDEHLRHRVDAESIAARYDRLASPVVFPVHTGHFRAGPGKRILADPESR